MECERLVIVEVGVDRAVVLGKVVAIHIRDDCVLDKDRCYIDTPKLDLIGRMHGSRLVCAHHRPVRDAAHQRRTTGRCARPPSSRPARAVAVGARGRDWRAIGARGRYWRAVGARSWRLARGGGRGRYGFRGCRPAQWAPLLRRSRGSAARSSYSIARESNASSARSSITSAASRLNRAACASRKALSSISDPCQVAARILRSCAGERIDVDQACLHAGRG